MQSLEQVLDHIPAQWARDAGQFFQDKIVEITQTPVKVAICGESGTGKSTLINTLRGLPPPPLGWVPPSDDPTLPAQVDIEECSMEPRAYRHPAFPSVEFWDLPGCGTVNFPIEEYAERVGLAMFDFYIIMDCGRFRSTDVFLANLIEVEYRKPFFFVRSKVDVDVDSERRRAKANRVPFDPKQVLEKLRSGNIKKTLGNRADQVFFVSGHLEDAQLYDLPRLQKAVVESLPSKAQRNMLLLSLSSWSREMIEDKYRVLQAQTLLFAGPRQWRLRYPFRASRSPSIWASS